MEALLSDGQVLPVPLNLQQSSVAAEVEVARAREATTRAKIFKIVDSGGLSEKGDVMSKVR